MIERVGWSTRTSVVSGARAFPSRWPSLRLRPALLLLALFCAVGSLQASALRLTTPAPPAVPYTLQLTGAIAAWLALPCVQLAVMRASVAGAGYRRAARFVLTHALGYVGFTLVHVGAMLALRAVAAHALGVLLPPEPLARQITWEAQSDLVLYAGIAALWTLLTHLSAEQRASVRRAELEAELARARLAALTAQLDPHFLFNALNTLSTVMYEDVARADRLIASLGRILRATLTHGAPTWALADELEHGREYVRLLEERFGERLTVQWRIEAGLDAEPVPRFALQSLIENAVKHNQHRVQPLTLEVSACVRGFGLELAVRDDGEGFGGRCLEDRTAAREGQGSGGLARLSETLRLLYGERAHVVRRARDLGAEVALHIPLGDEPSTSRCAEARS